MLRALLGVGRIVKFVIYIETARRHDLEKGFAIEVDLTKVRVFLIVDIGVSKACLEMVYPLERMRPLVDSWNYLVRLTPWMRIISPQLKTFSLICKYLNKL